ncbi:hypothetical protein GIB67_040350 [Kingdonia uniflora]|uniref:Uncharacterized protein n=1 Tax=Kingdonia uniflora TaxID=39325 RepID=A0A7J7L9C6_9MAGN|nr:hypothetical protein GIB67_040350 [Kingdonia uniflora]
MVELCEDDPHEASKEMKRSMFQAIESLDLVRGTEASLISEVKVLKRDLEVITKSFDERLEHQRFKQERVWVAKLTAKEREKVEQKIQEGDTDVIGGADGGTGGGEEASVIEVISAGTMDCLAVDGAGSKLSTGGSKSVGTVGPVGEKDAALPI